MTANQQWKQSGTKMPFKQWLKEQQQLGLLDTHEAKNFYASGAEVTVGGYNVKTIVLFALVSVAAFYVYKTYKK